MKTIEDLKITDLDKLAHDSEYFDCEFIGLDLRDVNLSGCIFNDSIFKSCNLSNVSLTNSSLSEISFKNCKMLGFNFNTLRSINNLKFYDSNLSFCILNSMKIRDVEFINCKLDDSDFSEGKFESISFEKSKLSGVNFSNSNLLNCNFSLASDYYIDPRFTKIKGSTFSMPEALSLLNSFEIKIDS